MTNQSDLPPQAEYQRVARGFHELAEELRRKVNEKRGYSNPQADLAALAERMNVDLSLIPDAKPARNWRQAG